VNFITKINSNTETDEAPPTHDLGLVDGLMQLSFSVQALLGRVAAENDLSLLQARLLGVLRDRTPGMAQLAHVLNLDKSSATGLVDRAVLAGLVRRSAAPHDGRAVQVELTAKGRRLTDLCTAEIEREIFVMTSGITEPRQKLLSTLASDIVLRDVVAELVANARNTRIKDTYDRLGIPEAERKYSGEQGPTASTHDRIAVVIGSTRPGRICPGIAAWFLNAAQEDSSLHYELLDLAEIDLPFLDEPFMAALNRYEHEHTKAWSRVISSFDGFVFVFPQYNWGYPAVLKNALDFLYLEWANKPVTFVTYGTRGGSKAAAQISGVLGGLHMRELADHLEVIITKDDLDEQWQIKDIDGLLQPHHDQIRTLDTQMVEALKATE
jgi:NAD(P)H-dependent FMN reductase/DNA-binding MarR family transcriptional regulator